MPRVSTLSSSWIVPLVLVASSTLPGCLITPNTSLLDEAGIGTDAGTDGPSVDLPRPDAPPPDSASDLGSDPDTGPSLGKGNARVFYGEPGPNLYNRVWTFSSGAWSSPAPALGVKHPVFWAVNKVSPMATGDESGLVLSNVTGGLTIKALKRTGPTSWTEQWSYSSSLNAHANKRGLDIEYESISGDLLVVYSNNTPTPVYRTRSGGAWSAEQPIPINDGPGGPLPDLTSGAVLWIELQRWQRTDEIALAYADDNDDLAALVWDGKKWDTATGETLETELTKNPQTNLVHQRTFDMAYEGQTGNLLVVWGIANQEGRSKIKVANSTTWFAPQKVYTVSGQVDFVDVAGHPTQNLVAAAFLDQGQGTERLGLATWTGGGWVDAAEYDSQIRDINDMAQGDFPASVAWLGSSDKAVCVYSDDSTEKIDWYTWTLGTQNWQHQNSASVPNKGYTESVQLATVPGQNALLALFSDDKMQLWSAVYSNNTWKVSNNGKPLSTKLTLLNTVPFFVDFATK